MGSDQEVRHPCGVKGCGVWFTSEEARDAHRALVHDPDDVAAVVQATSETENQTPDNEVADPPIP